MADVPTHEMIRRFAAGALPFVTLTGAAEAQTPAPQTTPSPVTSSSPSIPSADLGEIEITAPRFDLLGSARSASEGFIDDRELQLTPIYRPGQLLETVPGLTITQHSGEGKANSLSCVATTSTMALISKPLSTACRSTSPPTRTARATPTSIS